MSTAEERMQNEIDELEQENRLLRARNDRLEKEISELQENGCKFPLCQNEEYQQELAEQIKRELYTGNQPTEAQVIAGAKALSIHTSQICGTDEGDQWKVYGEELIEDARVILTAAFNLKG
jgi:cell division septum initiation protein DivIVA